MDQHTEIALLDEATERMNVYVRALVRNKKVKEADAFCDEKYAQIAAAGFFKRILAHFTERGNNDDVCAGADTAGIYEYVSAKLPDRAKFVQNTADGKNDGTGRDGYISIDVGEKVTLKLWISGPGTLAATVCVPPPEVWKVPV